MHEDLLPGMKSGNPSSRVTILCNLDLILNGVFIRERELDDVERLNGEILRPVLFFGDIDEEEEE
eukprot:TRINITY_DN97459_c0_g1_i1.p2 TRINITY_DN97459_c0_g1~~TRINITY_DN97459_c0_g1_i1.p2  ORF type:complete len:65 (+),score=5.54 TRINITY_DN97459_c0_g1_i1:82-276(+)